MKRLACILALLGVLLPRLALGAIAFVATSNGPNNSGTSSATTLPTGFNSAGNCTWVGTSHVMTFAQDNALSSSSSANTWVKDGDTGAGVAVFHRCWQAGDASGMTISSTVSSFWDNVAVTYSGVDTVTPVDGTPIPYLNNGYARVLTPGMSAAYANDVQLTFCGDTNSGGGRHFGTFTGFTERGANTGGPGAYAEELAHTDGTPSAPFSATVSGSNAVLGCITLLLKASGAATTPAIATQPQLVEEVAAGSSTIQLPEVAQNDLLLIAAGQTTFSGSASLNTPSGMTSTLSHVSNNASCGGDSRGNIALFSETLGVSPPSSIAVSDSGGSSSWFLADYRLQGQAGAIDTSILDFGACVNSKQSSALTPANKYEAEYAFGYDDYNHGSTQSVTGNSAFSTGQLNVNGGPGYYTGFQFPTTTSATPQLTLSSASGAGAQDVSWISVLVASFIAPPASSGGGANIPLYPYPSDLAPAEQ